ncbi:MAG TPA: substrate-binding domain-containing protein [Burkholderiaceae bacterium]|jgi:molybdate transport system substrate-binding protein|nr:substrate-binding domain-containing protein [Burkholderiaceae bacterium]
MTPHESARLHVLSAGAAQGLVESLAPRFLAETGVALLTTFGAVGAMREKLLAGDLCDAFISTQAMVDELSRSGHVAAAQGALGYVRTAIAIRAGDALPEISHRAALQRSLCAATEIFLPDPQRATAGIHFTRVIDALGIQTDVAARLRPYASGAAAMHALAQSASSTPIGCTQMSEIIYVKGVALVGALPREFELATVYSVAVSSQAQQPELARRFAQLMCHPEVRSVRTEAGFET